MSLSKHTFNPLAVLAAATDSNIGTVALSLAFDADGDGWCQLLPAGHFSAVDGRPHDVPGGQWLIDAAVAQRVMALASTAQNDLVIDYEHQTLNADQNGQPAPAAGWFKQMEWREGSGLWIKPQWTSRALDFIKNGEYKFLSAVFPYDKRTGEPLSLHSAALVNRPGIDGMQALEALRAQLDSQPSTNPQETPAMNKAMRKLLAKLGIELGEGEQLSDEQGAAALSALTTLQTSADKAKRLETEVVTLKAKSGTQATDLSQYVPAGTYNALVVEMAALKANGDKNTAEQLITDAQAEGKVMAAEVDYLTQFSQQQGVAALKEMLEKRPAFASLKSTQTHDKKPPEDKDKDGAAVLSAEEKSVCLATGISEADFLKTKQGEQ